MKKSRHTPTLQSGFTLIETILYISIISIFLYGAVAFAFNFISIRTKSNVAQEVNDNLRLAMDRIAFEIRNTDQLNSISPTNLSIGTSTTIISLTSGQITINSIPLTSNLVNISSINFTNSDGTISYSITGNYINSSGRSEYEKTLNYSGSTQMRIN